MNNLNFQEKPYIAIIGDIINSKKIEERYEAQKRLTSILECINKTYKSDIVSKFMITLGDEFQGLLRNGSNVINIIQTIERKMHPTKIRFGIGVGAIRTDIKPEIPLGADGPAYHNARQMIEEIRKMERRKKASKSNIRISIDNGHNIDILLNSIFDLCTALKSKWTKRQREIIFDQIEHGDNQSDTARRLGITQSSVQKALAESNFYTYKKSLSTVSDLLGRIKGSG